MQYGTMPYQWDETEHSMRHHIQARINEHQYRQYSLLKLALGVSMDTLIVLALDAMTQAHSEEITALAQTTPQGDVS